MTRDHSIVRGRHTDSPQTARHTQITGYAGYRPRPRVLDIGTSAVVADGRSNRISNGRSRVVLAGGWDI